MVECWIVLLHNPKVAISSCKAVNRQLIRFSGDWTCLAPVHCECQVNTKMPHANFGYLVYHTYILAVQVVEKGTSKSLGKLIIWLQKESICRLRDMRYVHSIMFQRYCL